MAVSIDTVLAGSGDFVAAVGPALRARSGGEPRVAADPRQAFTLCAQAGGLFVLQYGGREWLPVVRDLRSLCGDAIAMVVAVAPERVEEIGNVQRAGADEVVPWDGRAEAVQWAVERALASRHERPAGTPVPQGYVAPAGGAPPLLQRMTPAAAMPAASPRPVPPPLPQPPPPLPQSSPLAPAPAPAAAAPAPAATPAPGAAPWPTGVPEGPDAEWLLKAAVDGVATPPGPQRQAADAVAATLSELERGALQGAAVPVDADLVRSASVLRLRVALALASVPAAGSPVDDGAVQALLAELDGALGRLKAAAEGCPADALPALEALRTALVSEAIDLTEAVQRVAPAAAAALAPAAERPAAQPVTRVLSVHAGHVEEAPAVRRGWLVLFVLVALATAGFHAYRYLTRVPPAPPPSIAGAPANTYGVDRGKSKLLMTLPGKRVDPVELEKFTSREALKGNAVREVAPGTWVIEPAGPAGGGAKP